MTCQKWDTLQLTLSTDPQGIGCVRVMYCKEDLEAGHNIIRERRFNREAIPFPEIIVEKCTDTGFAFRAYYEDEEEFAQNFELDMASAPEIEIRIGTEEIYAMIGLKLLALYDPEETE